MSGAAPAERLERVYVWELPVRLCHWLLAASLVVLAVTGLYIGNPFIVTRGETSHGFVMGTVKLIHNGAAIVFTLTVLTRLAWMVTGNRFARWDQFLPVSSERRRGIPDMAGFYAFLKPTTKPYVGHNPLAGLVYSLVFALCLLQIATGLALYSVSAHVESPMRAFAFLVPWLGGLQIARFVHHIVMWLLVGFAAHHVWSAVTISFVERNGLIDSMFSGFKFARPELLRRASERTPGHS